MKRVYPSDGWPDSWKYSYPFDLEEVYGEIANPGYAYAYANRRKHTLDLLREAVAPPASILDIAAAQGNFSLTLAEEGYRVTWNDLRSELAAYVRMKHERGDIVYAPGNAFELRFPELFDAVLITEIIEHVAHPDQFLANAAALAKPGGFVVMTTPNGRYVRNNLPKFSECPDPGQFESVQFKPDSNGHIFLLHPDEVPPLAKKAGLEIDRMSLFTNPLTNGHMMTTPLLKALPRGAVESLEAASRKLPGALSSRILIQMGVRFRKPAKPAARI